MNLFRSPEHPSQLTTFESPRSCCFPAGRAHSTETRLRQGKPEWTWGKDIMKRASILAAAILLASCGQSEEEYEDYGYEDPDTVMEDAGAAADAAVGAAMAATDNPEPADGNYGATLPPGYVLDPSPAVRSYSPSFAGYPCTDDCSGHEAGYAWAEEKGIDDPDICGGNSQSFIEGCQAYAEGREAEYDSGLEY